MAKKDRRGNRKLRRQQKSLRVPDLGYYLLVTDTEGTERCFFDGVKQSLPENIKDRLVIKVIETETDDLIGTCRKMMAEEAQYRLPWIVFDRDQVPDFDKIIHSAYEQGIKVGWSNPCFEIWMFAYFGSMPNVVDSVTCCSQFGHIYKNKTGQKYSKSDDQLYGRLCKFGNEDEAIEVAQKKLAQCDREGKKIPSEMCPCTTVHTLLREIKSKCKCQ